VTKRIPDPNCRTCHGYGVGSVPSGSDPSIVCPACGGSASRVPEGYEYQPPAPGARVVCKNSIEVCTHPAARRITRVAHGFLGDAPAGTIEILCADCGADIEAPTVGDTITAVRTNEVGTVTYVAPEGAIDVRFADDTNCRLGLSEYQR
jgi:hypothetical protein